MERSTMADKTNKNEPNEPQQSASSHNAINSAADKRPTPMDMAEEEDQLYATALSSWLPEAPSSQEFLDVSTHISISSDEDSDVSSAPPFAKRKRTAAADPSFDPWKTKTKSGQPRTLQFRGGLQRLTQTQIQALLKLDDAQHSTLNGLIKQDLISLDLLGNFRMKHRTDTGNDNVKRIKDVLHSIKQTYLLTIPGYEEPENLDEILWSKALYINQKAKFAKSDAALYRFKEKLKPKTPVDEGADADGEGNVDKENVAELVRLETRSIALVEELEQHKEEKEKLMDKLSTLGADADAVSLQVRRLGQCNCEIIRERTEIQEHRMELMEKLTDAEWRYLLEARRKQLEG